MQELHRPWSRPGRCVALVVMMLTAVVSFGATADAESGGAPAGPPVARQLATGGSFACVVVDSGSVQCWGDNLVGQLGIGDGNDRGDDPGEMGDALPVVALGTGRTAVEIAAGEQHACAILDDGSLKCWGGNSAGSLGLGDALTRGDAPGEMGDALPAVALGTGRTARAVALGASHTCAILDDGSVKCWGSNSRGELGYGDVVVRGDNPTEMGDALPTVALGTGRTAVALSAGEAYTCAILDDGSVKCWGISQNGRLGSGSAVQHLGDGAGEMGDALPVVALGPGRTAVAIASDTSHTCVILDNGSVKCWGFNADGRLGYGDTNARGDGPGEMGASLPNVDLGAGRTALSLTTGGGHTCAVLDTRQVKCWGRGGGLGLGDNVNRGDGPNEMGGHLLSVDVGDVRTVGSASAGTSFTCVILDNGRVKCWGSTSAGVLGTGDTDFRGTQPGEMGDNLPPIELQGTVAASDLSIRVTANRSSIVAGQTVTYSVVVENTGGQDVTDIGVFSGDVSSCVRSIGSLATGATETYTCTRSTTSADAAGVSNQLLVASESGLVRLSNTVRTSVDPVSRRSDGLVRLGTGTFAGNNTYNTTGAGQTKTATVAKKGTARFTIRAQNDGNTAQALTIKGPGGTTTFTVVYKRGTTNITSRVVAGTYTTGTLAPGATHDITLTVTAKTTAKAGNAITRAVTITAGSTKDTVKATVTRR